MSADLSATAPAPRFEWTFRYVTPPAQLMLDVNGVTLTRGEQVQRTSLAEFGGGAMNGEVESTFDFPTLMEALALALPASQVLRERGVPSAPLERPKVTRVHGGGRGAPWVVFLLGRTVSGRAQGVPFELSFEDLLERGLPADVAAVLGDDLVATVTRDVQLLAPLACMCDTGCETQDQHGSTTTLFRRENPNANVEFLVTVAQCSVCERLWSFEMVGDSHYSYQCRARPVLSVPSR